MFSIDRPILAPGICFLCEVSNQGKWTDTLRDWEPNGYTHLNGRKYVCESCGSQIAKSQGWIDPDEYAHACQIKDDAMNRADDLAIRLAAFTEFSKAVDAVKNLFPEYEPLVTKVTKDTITVTKVPRNRPKKIIES